MSTLLLIGICREREGGKLLQEQKWAVLSVARRSIQNYWAEVVEK